MMMMNEQCRLSVCAECLDVFVPLRTLPANIPGSSMLRPGTTAYVVGEKILPSRHSWGNTSTFVGFALLPRGTSKDYQDLPLEIATVSHRQAYDNRVLYFTPGSGS